MKKVLIVLSFSILLLLSFSKVSFAQGENNVNCIDIAAYYEEVSNASQALVGKTHRFDSIRRTQILTTLIDLITVFVGDGIYCIKDEEAKSKTNAFKSDGIFGLLDNANSSLLSGLPEVSVTNHLAEEFVPGYKGNNSTLAQAPDIPETCITPDGGLCDCEGPCNTCTSPTGEKCTNTESTGSERCVIRGGRGSYTTFIDCECGSSDNCLPIDDAMAEWDLDEKTSRNKAIKAILDALSKYLGFGKIDYDRIEADAEQAVTSASGYEYLQNVKLDALWSVTRNIAYLFFVVAMIIIGFMIMFRSKIGGQVMVSVGNSIPRLIVCLLLVTFSFAISGIMLDIGKVSMNVIGNLMVKAQEDATGVVSEPVDIASIGNLTDRAVYEMETKDGPSILSTEPVENELQKPVEESIDKALKEAGYRVEGGGWVGRTREVVARTLAQTLLAFLLNTAKRAKIDAPFLDLAKNILVTGAEIPNFSRMLKTLVIFLVAAYASFKLFVTIITSYAKIFVNVVLGPIQIALGAIPGNFNSVSKWFKTLAASVLVFPTIVAVLGFAQFLAAAIEPETFVFFGNKGVFLPEGLVSIKGVLLVGGYFFAASTPNLIKGIIKIEEDKTMSSIGDSMQRSMSKIPMIGGIFGK